MKTKHARIMYAILSFLIFTAWTAAYAGVSVGTFTLTAATNHGIMVWETPNSATPLALTNGQVLIGSTGADPVAATLTQTSNQVLVATGGGTITLSTPQDIATTSDVTFNSAVFGGNTAKAFVYSDASKKAVSTAAAANGELLIGSTGAVPAKATISQGAGITVTNGAGTITIAANGGGSLTVTSKTADYTVLSGDSGTFFDNTGAGGSVNFTLPTAAAGLHYYIYTDAVQTVTVTAGTSTTIRIGSSISASAGNITNNTAGTGIHLVAISATQWVAQDATGTWTIN